MGTRRILCFLGAPMWLLCLSASAAEPEGSASDLPVVVLPEKVVTATRLPSDSLDTPFSVREISAERIAEILPRSLPDALGETPGVSVQKTANGQGSPYIRGFTGFRNLALIDGVRFNNSTFREGPNQYWSTIDLLSLDRIELVPGQGSVLYGSDAIGGTLNLLTKRSPFATHETGRTFFEGLGSWQYSSGARSQIGHVEVNTGQGGSWGFHADGSFGNHGDIDAAGIGRQPYTNYDQTAWNLRFDARLNANWTLSALHQQVSQDDVWRTHATIYGIPWEGTVRGTDQRRSTDQERSLSWMKLEGTFPEQPVDSINLLFSWQSAGETATRIRSNGAAQRTTVDSATWGADLQFSSTLPFQRLTYGLDYYRDLVDSGSQSWLADGTYAGRGIQGPVGDDSTYDLLGFYLQDEITTSDRSRLFLGGRYTYARADVGRYEDPATGTAASLQDSWNNFSSSARFVLDLDSAQRVAAFAGVSQGFRAPNLSDLSRLDIARSGELEIASTNLDPEEFLTFETGLKASSGPLVASLSIFHTRIENLIVRQPTGQQVDDLAVVTKANAGDGFVQGVEFAANYQLDDHWSVFGHVSYTEGEAGQYPSSDGSLVTEPLSRVVPWMGGAGVRWQSLDGRAWTELLAVGASKADRLSSADRADNQRIPPGGTPGWVRLSVRGGWQLTSAVSLTASLDNLPDEEYRVHGSGSNEPGFGGTVGVTLRF